MGGEYCRCWLVKHLVRWMFANRRLAKRYYFLLIYLGTGFPETASSM